MKRRYGHLDVSVLWEVTGAPRGNPQHNTTQIEPGIFPLEGDGAPLRPPVSQKLKKQQQTEPGSLMKTNSICANNKSVTINIHANLPTETIANIGSRAVPA